MTREWQPLAVRTAAERAGVAVRSLRPETAAEKRARLGWRDLTDAERDEQLRRNLDDLCPASSTEVEPND